MRDPHNAEPLGGRLASLAAALEETLLVDRPRLARRCQGLADAPARGVQLERLAGDIERSHRRVAARRSRIPQITIPTELPIAGHAAEIARLITAHQVIVVCSDTGSGKSTQLPKICLMLGRGAHGTIGHTQPRRVAARTLAARIAAETGCALGREIGYAVRFDDRSGPETLVRVVTDGLLLAELERDRQLRHYDTLIVDEAHERSLNVDFLLGYLQGLLPLRPELRLIITSATIEPERFAEHFAAAPIIEIAGRQYPVELRYRPPDLQSEMPVAEHIAAAIAELLGEERGGAGDFLVFLPGEREIRETAADLRRRYGERFDVLPLYARLSSAEQAKVFSPGTRRRIVLATNVAETSLTVPRIRYVVDTGLARISRYSYRSKIQHLPVEPVSRAAADQRQGRCGRVQAGVCVRLYAEEDYLARPAQTEPEIRRTNLASVILQMEAYRLGRIDRFPFLDPPDHRYVKDGYRLLRELEAVDQRFRVTALGRRVARFPIDPRLARMLLAADHHGSLRELLIIAAVLSIQDPRERPAEKTAAADEQHAQFADPKSDFAALLALWRAFREAAHLRSRNALRRWCRERFLSYPRMLEWRDLRRQLADVARSEGLLPGPAPASHEAVHRAILSGLLSHIGERLPEGDYRGARGVRFQIFPGSGLRKAAPPWVTAAGLVQTTRTWAHTVAAVEPGWIEAAAAHLVKRHYGEPHWQMQPGRVAALERVTLYGLTLSAGRGVNYARIAPAEARRIFIRSALVEGACRLAVPFLTRNRQLLARLESLEARLRRPELLVDTSSQQAFYAARLPEEVVDQPSLERWLAVAGAPAEQRLAMRPEDLLRDGAAFPDPAAYPDVLESGGNRLALSYRFEPGAEEDGLTLHLPQPLLGQIDPRALEWLIPGWRAEKIEALLRGLPKHWRRRFVPLPDTARRSLAQLEPRGDFYEQLARWLSREAGTPLEAELLRDSELPAHLRLRIQVEDLTGVPLAAGRDLAALRGTLGAAGPAGQLQRAAAWQRDGLRDWDFEALPECLELERQGLRLELYPAIVDHGSSASLALLDDQAAASGATRRGVLRLLRLRFAAQERDLRRRVTTDAALGLLHRSLGPVSDLAEQLAAGVFEQCFLAEAAPPRERRTFEALFDRRSELVPTFEALLGTTRRILEAYRDVRGALARIARPAFQTAHADITGQLERLVHPGFVAHTPVEWFGELPRYLQAIAIRIDKLAAGDRRDGELAGRVAPHWQRVLARSDDDHDPQWQRYRWMIEEYRVSLWAQPLGTRLKVSENKLAEQYRRCRRQQKPSPPHRGEGAE